MTESMDPTSSEWPFDADQAWRKHEVADLFANVAPLSEEESFVIEDLTDKEWQIFLAAINE